MGHTKRTSAQYAEQSNAHIPESHAMHERMGRGTGTEPRHVTLSAKQYGFDSRASFRRRKIPMGLKWVKVGPKLPLLERILNEGMLAQIIVRHFPRYPEERDMEMAAALDMV